MGKSGGRKKKGGSNQVSINDANSNSVPDNSDAAVHLVFDRLCFERMAHELKEEGNKRFHSKDFIGALQQYDIALELAPQNHLDRAIFHSNRAACFMQMKPIDYETVIAECSLAIQVQPRFVRPLLRRALAYEAIGKHDMAMQDVQVVLRDDSNHPDALMIAQRVRTALGPRQEAQQDLQSRPSSSALGASAVRGAPIGGLGPCLPARPVAMKGGGSAGAGDPVLPAVSKQEKQQTVSPAENGPEQETQFPKVVLKPANGTSISSNTSKANQKASVPLPVHGQRAEAVVRWRPLKLVYYHDIRLAQMPVNCNFRVLRETVTKRFPSSKSVLIKYKDNDGDLVTITSTPELRLAESSVDKVIVEDPEDKAESIGMLRLHVVEVSPEQELPLLEEEEEKKVPKEKSGAGEDPECEELKMDEWLSELCGSHVGIDSDAHIDLHELGMKFCSEALKEAVTSDGAWTLALATSKYFLSKFTLQTAWNVGKYGIEAGTSLVPASVPRPIARISVTIVALSVSLFILKSFVSTVFFVLATMGLIYFIFIAVNKGEGPRGNGGTTSIPRSSTTKYCGFEI